MTEDPINARLQNEITHGKYLADNSAEEIWGWQTPAGKYRAEERFDFISNAIGMQPGMKVLELGFGTGFWSRQFGRLDIELTAIDISPALCERAKLLGQEDGMKIDFRVENAMDTSFPDETFDAVIGISVLHHLDPDRALEEIFRILKPGGRMAFSEPNFLNPQVAIERSTPFTRRIFHNSPDETALVRWPLEARLKSIGFRQIRTVPFDFLHPATSPWLIPSIRRLSHFLGMIPIIREIAGSIKISAVK
jgi:2-polyprenyl-3-methyl-5-hydroxy-6-metoxy-1,4-benzoquinol methylase